MKEAYRGPYTPDRLDNGNHQPVDLSLGEEAKGFVRKNAEGNPTWEHQELADQLYQWTDIFRDRLIDPVVVPGKEGKLPGPVIGFEEFDHRVLAYYRLGKNAFGLDDEIILNEKHLGRPLYSILETVLHEQLHLWQQRKGEAPVTRNYHNREFVEKCEALGLHPELGSGIHTRPADGVFRDLLAEYGVARPPMSDIWIVTPGEKRNWWVSPDKERKGRSTLTKWTCGCQNVRVGTKEFWAVCLKCGNPFMPVDDRAKQEVNQESANQGRTLYQAPQDEAIHTGATTNE